MASDRPTPYLPGRLSIRVHPRGTRPGVVVDANGLVHVTVHAAPRGDLANRAVIKLCARCLDVPPSRVAIVGGGRSRNKVLQIEGMDSDTARALFIAVREKDD